MECSYIQKHDALDKLDQLLGEQEKLIDKINPGEQLRQIGKIALKERISEFELLSPDKESTIKVTLLEKPLFWNETKIIGIYYPKTYPKQEVMREKMLLEAVLTNNKNIFKKVSHEFEKLPARIPVFTTNQGNEAQWFFVSEEISNRYL